MLVIISEIGVMGLVALVTISRGSVGVTAVVALLPEFGVTTVALLPEFGVAMVALLPSWRNPEKGRGGDPEEERIGLDLS